MSSVNSYFSDCHINSDLADNDDEDEDDDYDDDG